MNLIGKQDIQDQDFIDASELASDGYFVFLTTTVVSTTNSTSTIVINLPSDQEGLITSRDHPVSSLDRVYLTGTSGADGYYIIDLILSETSFTVNNPISNSTGGNIYFMYPVGAKQVGFDPTGTSIISKNVQDAIKELSENSVGITENKHEKLRQLIHFINEGPASGFVSGAYKEILPVAAPFPTSVIWYADSSKTNKIVEKLIIYNSNKTPHTITWKMYDSFDVLLATIIDTIAYNGIFEVNRVRTIS
jgi:hypothetical protein